MQDKIGHLNTSTLSSRVYLLIPLSLFLCRLNILKFFIILFIILKVKYQSNKLNLFFKSSQVKSLKLFFLFTFLRYSGSPRKAIYQLKVIKLLRNDFLLLLHLPSASSILYVRKLVKRYGKEGNKFSDWFGEFCWMQKKTDFFPLFPLTFFFFSHHS